MIRECIILAGGLGTRIRSEIPGIPKCLAPVAGKPFLSFILDHLIAQGVERFIFSVGYLHEQVEDFIRRDYPATDHVFSIEEKPLGTGGAIKLAANHAASKDVFVVNGDTLFRTDMNKLSSFHLSHDACCTLSLKPMKNFDRYGVVVTGKDSNIIDFREKKKYDEGLINGGVYALNLPSFMAKPHAEVFSFEKDYLERYFQSDKMLGLVQDTYFIDIGIPEDYKQANEDLKQHCFNKAFPQIDTTWTLFLDRDGVINEEKHQDYIHTWEEFRFYDQVVAAMKTFRERFKRIIIVTNQRGIGKGLTKPEDLEMIHSNMKREFENAGGGVDAVYYCGDLNDDHPDRKPNPGMGRQAFKDFPDIDRNKTIMIGNTLSDMEFGRNIGAYTIFLPTTRPEVDLKDHRIDAVFPSLYSFSRTL